MKTREIYLMFCFLLSSCLSTVVESEIDNSTIQTDSIIVEMHCHCTSIQQLEYLQLQKHNEFLTPQLLIQLENNDFLRKKLHGVNNYSENVFNCDEIPWIKETNTRLYMFKNGESEFYYEDLTPSLINPLLFLTNTSCDNNQVFKTVIKAGYINRYNKNGTLLTQEACRPFNFPSNVTFLMRYLHDRALIDIRNHLISSCTFNQDVKTKKKLLSDGNISVDFYLSTDVMTFGTYRLCKIRLKLNPEMTKLLGFDLFQGDQLIQKTKFTYYDTSQLKSSWNGKMLCEYPKTIDKKILGYNDKGFPVICHSKVQYDTNQVFYYRD